MLVISRKQGQGATITLPDGRAFRVVVTLLDRGKVRLGFEAPRDVLIHRDELLPLKRPAPAAPTPPSGVRGWRARRAPRKRRLGREAARETRPGE
jgi:carbon storage regulator